MGQMIRKPDANPIVLAVCNLFVFGALGYYLMGQQKKAMYGAGGSIGIWVLMVCVGTITLGFGFLCFPLVFVAPAVFAYDAYLLGQKLQNGQSIGENENGLEFLNAIFKD